MEHLLLSLHVVFPMFFLLTVGYLSRRSGLVEEQVYSTCTSIVFQLTMPVHLFMSIGTAELDNLFDWKIIAVAVVGVIVFWLIGMVWVPRVEKDRRKCGAMVQGFFRSNAVLFGVTIAETLGGPEAVGPAAIMVAIIVPLYNVMSVITLEYFRGGKPNGKKLAKGVVTNPLIIGAAAGFFYLISGWRMPSLLYDALDSVASIATPLAVISLGGTFRFSALRGNAGQLVFVNLVKLVLEPLFIIGIALLLGMRGVSIAVLLAVCATPVSTISFPMTQRMGGDGELAGQIVISTVLFSVLSNFIWVFVLGSLGVC